MEIPEAELPEKNEPKPWIRDKALETRINRLKRVRDRYAKELKIDPPSSAPATSSPPSPPAARSTSRTCANGRSSIMGGSAVAAAI